MLDLEKLVEIGGRDLIDALRELIPRVEDYLEGTKLMYYKADPQYLKSIRGDRRALRRALAYAKKKLEECQGVVQEPHESSERSNG